MSLVKLTEPHREHAEKLFVHSAKLMVANAGAVHYTEGQLRWSAIEKHLRSYKGQFLRYGDCSSTGSWMHWDATRRFKLPDYLNGEHWNAGFTGTIAHHGLIVKRNRFKIMDACLYGPAPTYSHVTWCVVPGDRDTAVWFSHGGEAGPYYLKMNYRGDFGKVQRHIA